MDIQIQYGGVIPICHDAYAADTKINNLFWIKVSIKIYQTATNLRQIQLQLVTEGD